MEFAAWDKTTILGYDDGIGNSIAYGSCSSDYADNFVPDVVHGYEAIQVPFRAAISRHAFLLVINTHIEACTSLDSLGERREFSVPE